MISKVNVKNSEMIKLAHVNVKNSEIKLRVLFEPCDILFC